MPKITQLIFLPLQHTPPDTLAQICFNRKAVTSWLVTGVIQPQGPKRFQGMGKRFINLFTGQWGGVPGWEWCLGYWLHPGTAPGRAALGHLLGLSALQNQLPLTLTLLREREVRQQGGADCSFLLSPSSHLKVPGQAGCTLQPPLFGCRTRACSQRSTHYHFRPASIQQMCGPVQ